MSEEEKKAIERIKKLLIVEKCDCEIHTKNKKAVETIVHLIEKQQKEIKELNTELQIRIKWQQYFEKEYINKDKITEKIKKAKEIKWHTPKLVIEYFEELLEEK